MITLFTTIYDFLFENWDYIIDILLVFAGLSAFWLYYNQKKSELYSAGTMIISQINLIESNILTLKNEAQLNFVRIYNTKPIIADNMWERYKHLFAKRLTVSDYECVQQFFDCAEKLERARLDICTTITNGWKDKSTVQHQIVANLILEKKQKSEIEKFCSDFGSWELVYIPDMIINTFTKKLSNTPQMIGLSAYNNIKKKSYCK